MKTLSKMQNWPNQETNGIYNHKNNNRKTKEKYYTTEEWEEKTCFIPSQRNANRKERVDDYE